MADVTGCMKLRRNADGTLYCDAGMLYEAGFASLPRGDRLSVSLDLHYLQETEMTAERHVVA